MNPPPPLHSYWNHQQQKWGGDQVIHWGFSRFASLPLKRLKIGSQQKCNFQHLGKLGESWGGGSEGRGQPVLASMTGIPCFLKINVLCFLSCGCYLFQGATNIFCCQTCLKIVVPRLRNFGSVLTTRWRTATTYAHYVYDTLCCITKIIYLHADS